MSQGRSITMVSVAALDRRYREMRLPCPPGRREALRASLESEGQREPVLVSDGVEEGRLVLLDGFKRVELLDEGEEPEVLARVVTLDGPASLAAILAANAGQQGPSAIEEAWIVLALQNDHGLTQVEIAVLLERHKSWVCRRLKLVEGLEGRVQEDVKLGLISPTIARELVRLPRGNQADACEAVSRHRLTSREAARLVDVLVTVCPEERSGVLSNPLAHISEVKRHPEYPPDPRLSNLGNLLRAQLLRMHDGANRLEELFMRRVPEKLQREEVRILGDLARPTRARVEKALARVGRLIRPEEEASGA